jgi:hypothetical protein
MPRLSDDGKREATAALVCVRATSHSASLTRHFPTASCALLFALPTSVIPVKAANPDSFPNVL